MIVQLMNEDGQPTYWDVAHITNDVKVAKQEAWRAYRELDYVDAANPPGWARAKVIDIVPVKQYDARDDLDRSIRECYRVIRERVAAGGPTWNPGDPLARVKGNKHAPRHEQHRITESDQPLLDDRRSSGAMRGNRDDHS